MIKIDVRENYDDDEIEILVDTQAWNLDTGYFRQVLYFFVAVATLMVLKTCFIRPTFKGIGYLGFMYLFCVIDVTDHLSDFYNSFFVPHYTDI